MAKIMDPIVGRLMGLRYKSHPWHGVYIGDDAPNEVTCFIEMVSTDTVKYEVDKDSGYLKIDRPQKYSTTIPALYGFLPQTYSGPLVADHANVALDRDDIQGDRDPLDVCVFTEKVIAHGDILIRAKPIGGIRMIDNKEADDKLICVMSDDVVYGEINDISELQPMVIQRLKHYFLTYKDLPGEERKVEITHVYGAAEAKEIIASAIEDYNIRFNSLEALFKM